MFVPLFLVACIGVALLRGGQIQNLRTLDVRHIYLFFVPLFLQVIAFSPLGDVQIAAMPLARLLYAFSLGCTALALSLNRHLPGALWIALGLFFNFGVIALNGGFMPVSAAAREVAGLSPVLAREVNLVPMTASTLLPWLGDILPLPRGIPFASVFSVGDVLIVFGAVLFIQSTLVRQISRT